MDYEIINVGSLPNDGSGDPLRVAYIKINNNFALTSNLAPAGNSGDLQFKLVTTNGNITTESFSSSPNLNYNANTNNFNVGANIIPLDNETMTIGDPSLLVGNIFLGQNALNVGNINVTETGNVLSFNVAVFPSNKGQISVGGITYGNANSVQNSTASFVTETTFPVTIYSVPLTEFSAAKFDVTSRESSSNNSQTATIAASINNQGDSVSYTVHNILFNGNAVTSYSMDIFNSNVRLIVTPFLSSEITHYITYQIKS